jgi:hypothetical protein
MTIGKSHLTSEPREVITKQTRCYFLPFPRHSVFVANKPLGNTLTTLHNIGAYMHSARSDPPAITQTLGYPPARDNHKSTTHHHHPLTPQISSSHLLKRRQRRTDYTRSFPLRKLFENFVMVPKNALRPTKFGSCGRGNVVSRKKSAYGKVISERFVCRFGDERQDSGRLVGFFA